MLESEENLLKDAPFKTLKQNLLIYFEVDRKIPDSTIPDSTI